MKTLRASEVTPDHQIQASLLRQTIVFDGLTIYRIARRQTSSRDYPCPVALGSLTRTRETGKDASGEVMRSCWPLPVGWPQEVSVLVLVAWVLGGKWKLSELVKPGVAHRPSLNGSSTPHPLETYSVIQIHSWKEPRSPLGDKQALQRNRDSSGQNSQLMWWVENGRLL